MTEPLRSDQVASSARTPSKEAMERAQAVVAEYHERFSKDGPSMVSVLALALDQVRAEEREALMLLVTTLIRQGSDNCDKSAFGDNLAIYVEDAIRSRKP